jgi:hypothetical protein
MAVQILADGGERRTLKEATRVSGTYINVLSTVNFMAVPNKELDL